MLVITKFLVLIDFRLFSLNIRNIKILCCRFFLASFYTKYDLVHFVVNAISLMITLVAKLPMFHGVRIFGINKYWRHSVVVDLWGEGAIIREHVVCPWFMGKTVWNTHDVLLIWGRIVQDIWCVVSLWGECIKTHMACTWIMGRRVDDAQWVSLIFVEKGARCRVCVNV